jgi:hypothetical protein
MTRGKSKSLATKLILCVLFISFVLSVTPLWADEIIIGTETYNGWCSLFGYNARWQTIYLASEIGAPYRITALDINVMTKPSQTLNNFTIRMKHTGLSVYPGSPNWESSDWITVYQANQTITTTGWVQFNFTTPFDYGDSMNLMVDISASNSYDGGCYRVCWPGGNRTIYYNTYSSDYGDPLTWSDRTPIPWVTIGILYTKLIVEPSTKVARPVFTPDEGYYFSEQEVVITSPTAGATIHYTTNGLDPTESDPVIASGSSILIDHSLTLKAKAWKDGLDPSNVKSADYQIIVATPVFAPDGGAYTSEQDVVITCSTAGATIHYTTDGNDPTESDPIIASGDSVLVSVDPPTTLKARAWKTGLEPSGIKEATYLYLGLTSITPGAAKQGQSLTVTITGSSTNFGQATGAILSEFAQCTPTQGTPTTTQGTPTTTQGTPSTVQGTPTALTDVWLSQGSSTIDWIRGWPLYDTLFYALFNIPDDANPGKWDLHVEFEQCTPTTFWELIIPDGFTIAQPGDITCDGAVDFFDVAVLSNHWLEGSGE